MARGPLHSLVSWKLGGLVQVSMGSLPCDPVCPPTLSSLLGPSSEVPSWDYQQEAESTGLAFYDSVVYLQSASRSLKGTPTRGKQVAGG